MFQNFDETADGSQGPARLEALRAAMSAEGLDGFLVPRADAHQGEYVAARDDRLAWLTGFTGSAGWCVPLLDRAGVFVDSRYRVQVRHQTEACFEPVDWPEVSLASWINQSGSAQKIGFDPWLLTVSQHRDLVASLDTSTLVPTANLIDGLWHDQPEPPQGALFDHPETLAGESHDAKIQRLAAGLGAAAACVLTLPDSIAWLLNIRGQDIPRNPVPHAFALLFGDGRVVLFVDPAKTAKLRALGARVELATPADFLPALQALQGRVQIDPASCPMAVVAALQDTPLEAPDPCLLPKARKTQAELDGMRAAHHRDALAMVRFLAWLSQQDPAELSEIDVASRLEDERRATGLLKDISFETISGSGPNGAIVHYRVTRSTNRSLSRDELLLLDSGGQYGDGTTDITRTISLGPVRDEEAEAFTRVLKGMIALSRLRFPEGLAGRDIDAFARAALWEVGLDYGHGTGHGVGAYLSVHEGPARLARSGHVPLEAGMVLSNEPGFYKEGAFGIRIENLIVVKQAPALPGQTVKSMLCFETLTHVPIDTRLVKPELLTEAERDWLNAYHAEVADRLHSELQGTARDWLIGACQAI